LKDKFHIDIILNIIRPVINFPFIVFRIKDI